MEMSRSAPSGSCICFDPCFQCQRVSGCLNQGGKKHKAVLAIMAECLYPFSFMLKSRWDISNVTVIGDWTYEEVIKEQWGHQGGTSLILRIDVLIRRGGKTRDLPSHTHWGVATWGHSQKATVYKPEGLISPETELLAPWSWIPNPQDCENKLLRHQSVVEDFDMAPQADYYKSVLTKTDPTGQRCHAFA